MPTTPDDTAPANPAGAATESSASDPAASTPAPTPAADVAEKAPTAHADAAHAEDAHGDGEGGDGEGDDAEGEAGPEGPGGPAGEVKKKRRRRKKKSAGAAGPEGPQGPEGPATTPSAAPQARPEGGGGGGGDREQGPRKDRGDKRRDRGGPPNRERPQFTIGEEVFGKVTSVLDSAIMVDLAGKALAIFDRSELAPDDLMPSPGDRFVAQVLGDGSRGGLVVLSRKPLREEEVKPEVEKAFQEKTPVTGLVTGAIKGGLEVYVRGLRAFAPASHVDLRPGADLTHLLALELPFFVEQYAKRGRDVVLSRRSILEEEAKNIREMSLGKLQVGAVVKGVVRSIVAWGVFVAIPDADEVEGLIHNTELSHDPRARAQDIVKIGDEIEVKIQKIDERGKLWLSKRATEADPWEELKSKYAVGTRHKGTVTRIQPFGAFVELEPGLDGLLHVADISFKRVENVEDVIKVGQEVDVVVAQLDAGQRKIGLHPAPPEGEESIQQRIAPHKSIKVIVVAHDPGGLFVRILGATGRQARGFVPAGQTGTPRGTDLRKQFPVGSTQDVKVIDLDPRRGEVKLSVKAFREDNEKAAYNEYRQAVAKESKFGTFADLLNKGKT